MIYDRRLDRIRIYDPKGSFGQISIYDDPIYDIVKLSHSIFGNYDFIASELFTLECFGNKGNLQLANDFENGISRIKLRNLLLDRIKILGISFNELRILEAGLFISAPPLHAESNRAAALYLHGLEIIGENIWMIVIPIAGDSNRFQIIGINKPK